MQNPLNARIAARGPKNQGARLSEKKNLLIFLRFIGPVTALWVLQPSQIMHMVSKEPLLARAVFTKSIKVLGWQAGAPKSREQVFPGEKRRFFFELHRTSDTSMGSVSLSNHAFGLHRNFTGQSSV